MLVFGLFLAWQTKHVSIDVLNDSKSIGLAVYNVCVVSVVAVVAVVALRDTSYQQFTFVVTSLSIGVCTTVSLLLVFLPKVCCWYSCRRFVVDFHNPRLCFKMESIELINFKAFLFILL